MAGVVELALVVMTMKLWPKMFAGALAMAAGVLLLIGFAVAKDLAGSAEAQRAGTADGADPAVAGATTRWRRCSARARPGCAAICRCSWCWAPGVCVLAQMHIFGGGEATSFLIAKGQYAEAAQVDFYRVFGFIPLIATTALASGAYGIAGFTLVYPIGYLMPNPLLAGCAGRWSSPPRCWRSPASAGCWAGCRSVRDSSEHLRGAIGDDAATGASCSAR